MNLLADTIKFNRSKLGISAAELSRRVGKSSSYVAKVEAGSLDPSMKTFAKIAIELAFTDIEIAWLIRATAFERRDDGSHPHE